MRVEDVSHLSVSGEWGKMLSPQPFQVVKTCCSFPSVLQNLQPPVWKIQMLLFTSIYTELSDTSLAWSRGVEVVKGELGNWLLYWRIFWYLCYSSVTPLCSFPLYSDDSEQFCEVRVIISHLFLMAMQGDVTNAYCTVMDKVSHKLSPVNGCA